MSIELAYQQLASQLENLYEKREAHTIANWVIEHITSLKRIDRIVQKDKSLNDREAALLKDMTAQLLAHRPMQYVLGEAWFAGMPFFVNESVLIPRPETEELIEWIVVENNRNPIRQILDIGTGSGCIPITLKKKLPDASVMSIDISAGALGVAKINAGSLGAHIDLREMDFLQEESWSALPVVDCIVSNPPYIRLSEKSNMAENVLAYEPALALFVPDNDALLFYKKIAAFAKKHLVAKGHIFMEINEALAPEVIALFQQHGYQTTLRKDLQGKDRMVKAEKI